MFGLLLDVFFSFSDLSFLLFFWNLHKILLFEFKLSCHYLFDVQSFDIIDHSKLFIKLKHENWKPKVNWDHGGVHNKPFNPTNYIYLFSIFKFPWSKCLTKWVWIQNGHKNEYIDKLIKHKRHLTQINYPVRERLIQLNEFFIIDFFEKPSDLIMFPLRQ